MYFQNQTFIRDTGSFKSLNGEAFVDSGIVAVYTRESGKTEVKLSRGAKGEVFAGLSITRATPPRVMHNVIEDVVPEAGKALDLGRYPITGQILIKIDDAVAEIIADSAALAAGKALLEGDQVKFHADDAQKSLFVQMAYEPTVVEAQEVLGDTVIGGLSEPVTGQVTLVTSGIVGTSCFDASVDWAATDVLHPSLGADGKLTVGGAGTLLTNLIILEAPSSENASLVVDIQ